MIRRDLSAIEMTLPHEVELAIRRLDYRKVATICASDVAAETLRKLERHTRLTLTRGNIYGTARASSLATCYAVSGGRHERDDRFANNP